MQCSELQGWREMRYWWQNVDSYPLSRHPLLLQGGEKQRVFTGIVTSLHDYFGVVDEEVFFQLR